VKNEIKWLSSLLLNFVLSVELTTFINLNWVLVPKN